MIIGLLGLQALLFAPLPAAWAADGWLTERLDDWPNWQLPAPLPRPRAQQDLVYPTWFEGTWTVESTDLEDNSKLDHAARFGTTSTSKGAVVGDRNFNARAIGRAVLGDQLLAVEQAPGQVNRQLARLSEDRQLETTVIGRRQSPLDQPTFVSDELVLQILHGPGAPRISRIETLSRYRRCDDSICAEQWQARYSAPGEEITAAPLHVSHYRLTLKRQPDPTASTELRADRASGTGAASGGDH